MNKYSFDDRGAVLQIFYAGDGAPSENVIDSELSVHPNCLYVDGGKLTGKPQPPSIHHVFDYATKQWVDPRTTETEWPVVRAERDRRLLASDWTQLPDVPLATKEAWAVYRQALRDITLQPDPFSIAWPTPPA